MVSYVIAYALSEDEYYLFLVDYKDSEVLVRMPAKCLINFNENIKAEAWT